MGNGGFWSSNPSFSLSLFDSSTSSSSIFFLFDFFIRSSSSPTNERDGPTGVLLHSWKGFRDIPERRNSNMIIVLNDNKQVSLPTATVDGPAPPVGALRRCLNRLQSSKKLGQLHDEAKGIVNQIDRKTYEIAAKVDEYTREFMATPVTTLFEELGLYYNGPQRPQRDELLISSMKMSKHEGSGSPGWSSSYWMQTTEDVARAVAVAAAAATTTTLSSRPSMVFSSKDDNGDSQLQRHVARVLKGFSPPPEVKKKETYNPEVLTS